MALKREIKDAYIEGGNSIYVKTHSNAVYVDENETETLTQRLNNVKSKIDNNTSQLNDKAKRIEYNLSEYNSLLELINKMPNYGGTVVVPNGEFIIEDSITLTKPITFRGIGYDSVLKCSGNIVTDDNTDNRIFFENLKIVNTDTKDDNIMLKLTKGSHRFMLKNVWFHNETDKGTLLNIDGATRFSITDCWFTGTSIPSDSIGVFIEGKSQNINFSGCQFLINGTGIKCVGNPSSWEWLCGIRFVNNTIMSCNTGLYLENCDYMTFDNGMIDYCDKPVVMKNVSTPRIRGNYLFSPTKHTNIIEYIQTISSSYLNKIDISHNYMWNSSFTAHASENEATGIYICADGVDFSKGSIADNTFTKLSNGVFLETKNSGSIQKVSIHDNNSTQMVTNIRYTDGVNNCNSRDNLIDNTVSFDIIDGGTNNVKNKIKSKNVNVTITANSNTGIAITGLELANILSLTLIQSDDVYKYNPVVALTDDISSKNIWIKCMTTPKVDVTFTIKIVYKE